MKDEDASKYDRYSGLTRHDFIKFSGGGVAVPLAFGPTMGQLAEPGSWASKPRAGHAAGKIAQGLSNVFSNLLGHIGILRNQGLGFWLLVVSVIETWRHGCSHQRPLPARR